VRKKTATLAPASSVNTWVLGEPTPYGKAMYENAVRVRAYQKWETAGKPGGDGVKFWLEAERELLQARNSH